MVYFGAHFASKLAKIVSESGEVAPGRLPLHLDILALMDPFAPPFAIETKLLLDGEGRVVFVFKLLTFYTDTPYV